MTTPQPQVLQRPTAEAIAASRCGEFIHYVKTHTGHDFDRDSSSSSSITNTKINTYEDLHRWSIQNIERFHCLAWDFLGLRGNKGSRVLDHPHDMFASRFFPDGHISYTENMLSRVHSHPDDAAIISRVAGRTEDEILSWRELADQVSLWVQVLQQFGVEEGDRVSTYLPHIPEAYIILLACAELGAIFSSVGTEMGAQATINRFRQIQPKLLIGVDGYVHMTPSQYSGKAEERLAVLGELQQQLPDLHATLVLANLQQAPDLSALNDNSYLAAPLLQRFSAQPLVHPRRPFNQPLMILFSSGSTGQPKCFVHGVGGTLLKHGIEHQLQCDTRAGDRFFFHSTTSWMMFNWLAGGLAQGATLLIYDGNPVYPSDAAQLQFAAQYQCTHFGVAAAIIQDVWMKNDMNALNLDLTAMRQLMYTGSVLSEQGFHYLSRSVKANLSINGICGGTDFVGCYAAGNPLAATYAGQLKGPVLGMALEVWDEQGNELGEGEVGELVIAKPFASRPLYFWKDADNQRYKAEYFTFFAHTGRTVWRHGDAVKWVAERQMVVEGRSDTTLNQGGVRLGTQQIYDALNHADLTHAIVDSLATSFQDQLGSEHTILFVQLNSGMELDDALTRSIKTVISDSVGRLCTPHRIIAVPYVLKTPNGKKAEKPTAQLLKGIALDAPETYGTVDGILKSELFAKLGSQLRREFNADP